MRLKLVESLSENVDFTFELEFDIEELLEGTDDAGKASGTISLDIQDAATDLWDFISEDPDMLTDEQAELFQKDNTAWEDYLDANFDELIDRYEEDFRDRYFDKALDKVYDNWDNYSDEEAYSQHDSDMGDYYDLVAAGLR